MVDAKAKLEAKIKSKAKEAKHYTADQYSDHASEDDKTRKAMDAADKCKDHSKEDDKTLKAIAGAASTTARAVRIVSSFYAYTVLQTSTYQGVGGGYRATSMCGP